jgi:hypothetical protein
VSSPTLEEFVKNYINNKSKADKKTGYADWINLNGINSEGIYRDSLKDINGDYIRAKSEYGTLAERLGQLGLSSGGYSDYLNGKAYSEMQKRKAGAKSAYSENERKNRKGYGEYIEKLEKEARDTYENTVASITKAGIMNYDDAYAYAIGAGLTEENAVLAAKSAGDAVRKQVWNNAIKTVIEKSYNEKQAREYALLLGLSEEEANELGEYASKINSRGYYSSDYLDYIKDKVNPKNSSK